jgi:hypothetical protein
MFVTAPEVDAYTGKLSVYLSKAVLEDVAGTNERALHGVVALQLSLDSIWLTLETANVTDQRRRGVLGYTAVAYRSEVRGVCRLACMHHIAFGMRQ